MWSLFLGHLVVEKLLKAYHARKGFPEKLLVPLRVVPADSKDIRSRSAGLPEMSGNDVDYQFHGSTGSPCTVAAHPAPVEGWLVRARPPPKTHAQPVCVHSTGRPAASYIMDDVSQAPVNDDYLYRDPEYSGTTTSTLKGTRRHNAS